MNIEFTVKGKPITQGSMVLMRGRLIHSNSAMLKAWRTKIRMVAKSVIPEPLEDAVMITATFYLAKGKTVKRLLPSVRPDIDKLARSVLDALTTVAYYDDSQVIELIVKKEYDTDHAEGVTIRVTSLN